MLGGVAVSVILGMAVGAAISFDDPSSSRFASISGGVTLDVSFILVALVVVLYAIALSATLNPTILVVLGSLLLFAGLGGPGMINHIWQNSQINTQSRRSFVILAMLEFLGGAFLAAGLLDLIRGRKRHISTKRARISGSSGEDK